MSCISTDREVSWVFPRRLARVFHGDDAARLLSLLNLETLWLLLALADDDRYVLERQSIAAIFQVCVVKLI